MRYVKKLAKLSRRRCKLCCPRWPTKCGRLRIGLASAARCCQNIKWQGVQKKAKILRQQRSYDRNCHGVPQDALSCNFIEGKMSDAVWEALQSCTFSHAQWPVQGKLTCAFAESKNMKHRPGGTQTFACVHIQGAAPPSCPFSRITVHFHERKLTLHGPILHVCFVLGFPSIEAPHLQLCVKATHRV